MISRGKWGQIRRCTGERRAAFNFLLLFFLPDYPVQGLPFSYSSSEDEEEAEEEEDSSSEEEVSCLTWSLAMWVMGTSSLAFASATSEWEEESELVSGLES